MKRVIFISTPHRGSYMIGDFLRNLIRKLVSTPVRRRQAVKKLTDQLDLPKEARTGHLTSIDSMSPRNPALRVLAEIPVADNVPAHSIIAVKERFSDIKTVNDGVVEYASAHVDYALSEFVVRSFHSCQDRPETIEEVRRILHEHLDALPAGLVAPAPATPSSKK